MSEQEIDLDTAIQLFQLVENFDEYKEGLRQVLTRVHTQEELERARKVIDEKKQDLMESNPEFKAVMERRKHEAKQRAEFNKAIQKAKMAEVEAEASKIRSDAMSRARSARARADTDIDDWVAHTKIKTRTFDEAKKQSEQKLVCPICHGPDRGNVMNGEPFCFDCNHKLVQESELKDYPRKYRRAWKRKKEKRG